MELSEARFRTTFDDAPTGIALVGLDRRLITVNRALCTMLGYDESQLVDRRFDEITHPDDRARDLEEMRRMIAGGTATYRRQKRYLHRDGHAVPIELWTSLVRDAAGEPSHFITHIQDVSAAREAAQAAQEAQRLLEESQEIARVGSWSFTYETGELLWSDSQFRLHGLEPRPDRLGVADFVALLPEPDRAAVAARIAAREIDRCGFSAEYRVVLPDGSGRILATKADVLPADPGTGRRARISGVTRDVTAEREAQNRQRAIEQRHGRLLASLPDTMVALTDTDLRCVLVQGGLVPTLAAERDIVGHPLQEHVSLETAERIETALRAALGGETRSLLVTEGGRTFHVDAAPYLDEQERITGAFTVWRDITPRVEEQTARREAEDRLRVTVDHAPIGVALIDLAASARGRLISANESFAMLLGDPDPVAGQLSLTSVLHPEDASALRADLTLLTCDPQARTETEVRCLRPDGSVVWLLLTGAAVPGGEKPAGAPELAVVHALDIGERKRFEGRLQHLADHDTLTGLYNRRRFEAELHRAVSQVRRYGQPGALLVIDLDGFKAVNDSMGHAYGDELISRIGATLSDVVRETDVVGRLGGDEFALILGSVTEAEALAVAEKVLVAIQRHGVVLSEQRHAGVTASVGVALIAAGDRLDTEELMISADSAMYLAKQAGRNRVALGSGDGGQARITARRSWHERLRSAIENDRFELFAQPIRGICAEGVDRYELLLRMRGDDGEPISPATFLPDAERYDLVQTIDRWVFGRALGLLAAHEQAGWRIGLNVNMSGKTLCDPTLVEDLMAMMTACPIPKDRLIVEITETAAIVNIERAAAVARALRSLGCRFALDDFGSGFASYYYLKHLEFDFVKIDGEFVKALSSNPTDQLVVRSVVDLARGLGAETIAEFVGDEDSIRRLRELGVDYGQGFHLGCPAPVGEILPVGIA